MKKDKNIKEDIIDKFYGEENNMNTVNSKDVNIEANEFREKLKQVCTNMDKLKDIDFDIDVNILRIINEAEIIKEEQESKRANLLFVITALCIFSLIGIACVFIGVYIFLIMQAILIVISPLIIIPIAKTLIRRGRENE